MKKNDSTSKARDSSAHSLAEDFYLLSHRVLGYANRALPRLDFVRKVLKMIIEFSECDAVELRLKRREKFYRFEMRKGVTEFYHWEYLPCLKTDSGRLIPCSQDGSGVESLCQDLILSQFDSSLPFFTKSGSFWTNELSKSRSFLLQGSTESPLYDLSSIGEYESVALFPLVVEEDNLGILQLKNKREGYFTQDEIRFYEGLAQTLEVALVHRHALVALRERVKELTCLYGIARLVAQPEISLEDVLQKMVELLPPGWLYPEIATARIVLDGRSYLAPRFREEGFKQSADVVVDDKKRGVVEVIYLEEKPELDEGPFLKEERSLIDAVAREVALFIERKQAEEERSQLQNQLMHADRLATIGQLAAGVAHELNEPLGNILGFAQLVSKSSELSPQLLTDVEKIINASLHAREVVKKLIIFARQMPTKKSELNLNRVVEEGLYFFESRCAKEGIELVRRFSTGLPEITADPTQLHQVLVNLVVNAIQAMPDGGKLTIETLSKDGYISLIVEDTGIGMSDEILKQIFDPFFTTKEVGEGTGLGLSVVHGIVSSHGGVIKVESTVGKGSRFEVQLPVKVPSKEKENSWDDS